MISTKVSRNFVGNVKGILESVEQEEKFCDGVEAVRELHI